MTPDERWLDAVRPFVLDNLPRPPARVLEIGCGPLGGFVPDLRADGYQAIGIDPEAPEGPHYRRVGFEHFEISERVDAVVASVSLHHVDDLGDVLSKVGEALAPSGTLIVVEWARERFDEATSRWCFDRLGPTGEEHDWMREYQSKWRASRQPWDAWFRSWAEEERLHSGEGMLRELDSRFGCQRLDYGPYFFPGLYGVTEADEQAAIDSGLIRANRIQYVGVPR